MNHESSGPYLDYTENHIPIVRFSSTKRVDKAVA
jgi:hypothetical protein